MKNLIYKFPQNFIRIFTGRNLVWHIVAIFLTALIVFTGLDWHYFLWTRNPTLQRTLFPALIIGAIFPLIVPLIFIGLGKMLKNIKLSIAGYTLGQAAILGSLISSLYKAFTGRVQPDMNNLTLDISKTFQFGFWEHGIFWGWPSSHTTIAFAMAFSIATLFPKDTILRYCVILYAFYIGIGVSTNVHWLSEFVAGAIIGTIIGIVVGKTFFAKLHTL